MHVHVEISILSSPAVPVGRIYGSLELPVVPRVGEIISLNYPLSGVLPPAAPGFYGELAVEHVVHLPQSPGEQTALFFKPVILQSPTDARALMVFLELGFGLHAQELASSGHAIPSDVGSAS